MSSHLVCVPLVGAVATGKIFNFLNINQSGSFCFFFFSLSAGDIRDLLKDCLCTSQGELPWQYSYIQRTQ